jgi:GR25 family glycosyltransferase involved in LPS biosynthesis
MITHNYFLCNKDKEPDRYQSLVEQIKELGLENYSFFTYIWGDEITPEIRSKWAKTDTTMRYHGRNMNDKPLSDGEISLFLTHIECLRSIRASYTSGLFCIFESDALFYPSYSKKLERVIELTKDKNDIDIINIGSGNGRDKPKSQPINTILSLYKEKINRGTDAIIWTYKGVCNFLDYFDKTSDIDGPIDTKMDVYSEYIGGFNIHWAHPPLVYQGSISGKFKQSIR